MRQLALNKLALSFWCARGCCFGFNCSYFSSTSKVLPKAGHHLCSNIECKTVPSPNRWWFQYVLEAKGRMQWSKGVEQRRSNAARFFPTGIHQFNGQVETGGRVSWHCGMHPLFQSSQSSHLHIWINVEFVLLPTANCVWAGCLSTSFLNTSHQPISLSEYHLTNIHIRASPAQPSKRRSNLKPGLTP